MSRKENQEKKSIKFQIIKFLFTTLTTTSTKILCQTNPICQNPTDPKICNLVDTYSADTISFDFSSITQDFSIIGQNCVITANKNLTIKLPDSLKIKVTIALNNCKLSSNDVSIDLGDLSLGSSISLTNSSSINANGMSNSTLGMPIEDLREMICFTGCNLINSEYVYGAESMNYDITQGDSPEIQGSEYYGSGDNNPLYTDTRYTWGGGRVYIRTSVLEFMDLASSVSSNGFQGNGPQDAAQIIQRSGTGGSVLIAASVINFNNGKGDFEIKRQILAEGSNLYKQPQTNLGGGGRIFVSVTGMDYQGLENRFSVTGYGLGLSDLRANSGRITIKTPQYLYLIVENMYDKLNLKTAGTLLDFNTPLIGNNIAYFRNCNVTNFLKNSQANYYSITLNSTIYTLINNNPVPQLNGFIMNIGALAVTNQSVIYLNISSSYEVISTDGIYVGNSSNITVFENSYIILKGPVVEFTQNSLANIYASLDEFSNSRAPTIFIVVSDVITIKDSSIMVDKILFSPTSDLIIQDSVIGNIKGSCPSDDEAVQMDWFVRNCEVMGENPDPVCNGIWTNSFLEVELPGPPNYHQSERIYKKKGRNDNTQETRISFVFINYPMSSWMTNSTRFQNVGYLAIKTTNFTLGSSSIISASSSGCQALNPEIDSILSKYIKLCKVKGGSNLGRGTMGKLVNLQLCNFLMPMHKQLTYEFEATPVNKIKIIN